MVEIVIVPAPELPAGVLEDGEIAAKTAVLGMWINKEIAPAYSQGVYSVYSVHRGQPVPTGTDHRWIVWLHANSDVQGAAGYHTCEHNAPTAKIFVVDILAAAMDWTQVVTHEVAEMMLNRWCNAGVLGGANGQSGFFWQEACDPVERFGANFSGVAVSDFVLPAYWRPGAPGPYSKFGHAPAPLTPAPGCRQEVYTIASAVQIDGQGHITALPPGTPA